QHLGRGKDADVLGHRLSKDEPRRPATTLFEVDEVAKLESRSAPTRYCRLVQAEPFRDLAEADLPMILIAEFRYGGDRLADRRWHTGAPIRDEILDQPPHNPVILGFGNDPPPLIAAPVGLVE